MPGQRSPRWVAILGIAVVQCAVWVQYRGPAPQPADAPTDQFSAERAVTILRRLLGAQQPHPAGSESNDVVRRRLVDELERIELSVEIQRATPPNWPRLTIHNVLAKLPDTADEGMPLLLVTHYDSVLIGPGAGDDGAGLAAMVECARALRLAGPRQRPIYFLFTDGEEFGLLGAEAFVANHELAKRKPFVLNFDARGTSGPSLMYETHAGNLPVVREFARGAPRPVVTGSSFVTVARLIPNDSDFSVFRRAGWQGLNFAFVDGAHRYHTRHDTIENLDPRSVQHHGEYALRLARTLAATDLENLSSTDDAVFFDVLTWRVVWYPAAWSVPLALVAAGLILATNWRTLTTRAVLAPLLKMGLATLVAIAVAAAFGFGLSRLLDFFGLLTRRFVPYGGVILGVYWVGAAASVLGLVRPSVKRLSPRVIWVSVWLAWSIAALVIAWSLPGMSYLFLGPTLLAAGLSFTTFDRRWTAAIVSISAAVLVAPALHLLGVILGPWPGVALCPLFCTALSPLFPLLSSKENENIP